MYFSVLANFGSTVSAKSIFTVLAGGSRQCALCAASTGLKTIERCPLATAPFSIRTRRFSSSRGKRMSRAERYWPSSHQLHPARPDRGRRRSGRRQREEPRPGRQRTTSRRPRRPGVPAPTTCPRRRGNRRLRHVRRHRALILTRAHPGPTGRPGTVSTTCAMSYHRTRTPTPQITDHDPDQVRTNWAQWQTKLWSRLPGKTDQFVPGWPYPFVAALETGRTSWVAVLDAVRLWPANDATAVTDAQLRCAVEQLVQCPHPAPPGPTPRRRPSSAPANDRPSHADSPPPGCGGAFATSERPRPVQQPHPNVGKTVKRAEPIEEHHARPREMPSRVQTRPPCRC
ncbi:hypothetical protein SCANM124S_01754 [Streptomyces canus]